MLHNVSLQVSQSSRENNKFNRVKLENRTIPPSPIASDVSLHLSSPKLRSNAVIHRLTSAAAASLPETAGQNPGGGGEHPPASCSFTFLIGKTEDTTPRSSSYLG